MTLRAGARSLIIECSHTTVSSLHFFGNVINTSQFRVGIVCSQIWLETTNREALPNLSGKKFRDGPENKAKVLETAEDVLHVYFDVHNILQEKDNSFRF